jgi:hypothetical protein
MRRALEQDRKVELKMRLALKRLHGQMPVGTLVLDPDSKPRPETLGRLIAKVREL